MRTTMTIMSDQHSGARTLALGTPENRPAWLRRTEGERRWWVALALAVAIGLQFLVPRKLALNTAYIGPGLQLALAIAITITHPTRYDRRSQRRRVMSQIVLALVAITNGISLGLLVHTIVTGEHIVAADLLLGGTEIWVTNIIVFAFWYWEYDRGGPAARAAGIMDQPDLLFPQMTDEHLARDWEPIFVDYLYVSFTNSTAFSPTDTMPLSRWSKLLFTLEAAMSVMTVVLVAARAVNILPGH
jgi:hypothetical protein